jgi:hypothetical protein
MAAPIKVTEKTQNTKTLQNTKTENIEKIE